MNAELGKLFNQNNTYTQQHHSACYLTILGENGRILKSYR